MSRFADAHLDLAYLALRGRDLTIPCTDADAGCISLPALREAGVTLVCGTVYIDIGSGDEPWGYRDHDDIDGAEAAALRQLDVYLDLEVRGEIAIMRSATDPERHYDERAIRLVILMEGADAICTPAHAAAWFERGVRMVGLTWAKGSRYAGGNAAHGPLTPAGRELVAALDSLGVIHDISHLSDPAVRELFEIAEGPIVATHSNSRSVNGDPSNQRHLEDWMYRAIAARGGVIGLNLYSRFLTRGDDRRASMDDCIAHIEHAVKVTGSKRCIGLGSDADGGFAPSALPVDLDHPRKWQSLLDALHQRGWSLQDVDGFADGNWSRFFAESLPPPDA